MAIIDFVDWNPQSNSVFAYRFPETNLSTYTQLVVRESQEAVLFSKGAIMGKFGPGKHTLSTENLPILRQFYGLPFGGRNPFTAEVYFVNKTAPLNIDWTTDSMRINDPDYNAMIPLYAKGRYGLKVQDAERFLVQLVGTRMNFTAAELTDHFMGELVTRTKSAIINFMQYNRVGLSYISGHLDDLSRSLREPLAEFWENYGFHLEGYYINTIDVDTRTPEGKKISEAIADRSTQNIAGYTWQQKQSFEVANNATANGGGMSGILAAAMLTGGLGGQGGGMMGGGLLQQNYNQGLQQGGYQQGGYQQGGYQQGGQPVMMRRDIFCAKCGKKRPADVRFCSNCGKEYNPCPNCGSDNLESARRCVKCGAMFQSNPVMMNACSRCGNPVTPGTKFCPNCGNAI